MNDVIVVGTDGSPTANVAVERAAALAKLTGARLELVSGYRDATTSTLALSAGAYPVDTGDGAREGAVAFLAATAARLRSDGLQVETHCMRSAPADALIA